MMKSLFGFTSPFLLALCMVSCTEDLHVDNAITPVAQTIDPNICR